MGEPFKFLKKNISTLLMLSFVLAFYSLSFFSSKSIPSKETLESQSVKKLERMSTQEFKQKEAVFRRNLEKHPRLLGAVSLGFSSVLFLGLGVLFCCAGKKAKGEALFPSGPRPSEVPWGGLEVLKVFIFLFFAEATLLIFEQGLALFFPLKAVGKDALMMLNSLIRDIAAAGFVIYLVKGFKKSMPDIGLTLRDFFKNIATGLVAYLAVIPILIVVLFGISFVARAFSYEPPPQAVVEIYLKETRQNPLVFFTFFVALFGPFMEEIFFRGFAYTAFRSQWGVRGAALGTAAIFALLHMNFIAIVPIFILGLLLAALYEKTGSLVPCIAVHTLHNFVMVGLTLGFKALSE